MYTNSGESRHAPQLEYTNLSFQNQTKEMFSKQGKCMKSDALLRLGSAASLTLSQGYTLFWCSYAPDEVLIITHAVPKHVGKHF